MLLSEVGGERSSKRTLSETEVLLEFSFVFVFFYLRAFIFF